MQLLFQDAVQPNAGAAAIAFPGRDGPHSSPHKEQEANIKYLHEIGLDGMEAYYPNYSEDDEKFAHYLIEKYDLVPTGGTDFHGANRPSVDLGSGTNNNLDVPYEFYQNICKLIKR